MGFVNSIKNFVGIGDEDEYMDDEYYDDEYEEEYEEPKKRFFGSSSSRSKVVPISSSGAKVRILKPKSYDDCAKIADELKSNRLVIVNVKMLDGGEAQRIVDFISGTTYGVDGHMRRITEGIFVFAPNNVDISTDTIEERARSSFDWNV
ncbi:MAG: cell division protein SepF [Firmicutes bacterium]|nr:cell division protein SepF [Bacillota bacterium]